MERKGPSLQLREYSEYQLYQQHIDGCSGENAQQGVALQNLQHDHGERGNQFRQSVWMGRDRDILQALYHQHADDRRRQHLSEIGDIGRRLLPEDQERQKPKQDGCQ